MIIMKSWRQSLQDAISHCGSYVITIHLLIGSSIVSKGWREKLWWDFFLDPLKSCHRSEKVTKNESCPIGHVKDHIQKRVMEH
jgi:hypothetical protein